jgi:isoleucyl-tRNA synthetase
VRGGAASVHLAGWPEERDLDDELLAEVADVRRVVGLGHRRARRPGSRCSSRSGPSSSKGPRSAEAQAARSGTSCGSRTSASDAVDSELLVKPNLPVLGPKLGRELGAVREALRAGAFEELDRGRFRAAGHELEPDEVLVERAGKEGWAVAAEDGVTVAIDTHVDEELDRERRVYELIRQVTRSASSPGWSCRTGSR